MAIPSYYILLFSKTNHIYACTRKIKHILIFNFRDFLWRVLCLVLVIFSLVSNLFAQHFGIFVESPKQFRFGAQLPTRRAAMVLHLVIMALLLIECSRSLWLVLWLKVENSKFIELFTLRSSWGADRSRVRFSLFLDLFLPSD